MPVSDPSSMLAVRNPGRVSVMERAKRTDSPEYDYVCLCRFTADGTLVSYGSEIDNETIVSTVERLERQEAEPEALDPTKVPSLDNLSELDEGAAMALVLDRCFYADFMRYALVEKTIISKALEFKEAKPFDFRPVRPAFETLLRLDWAEMATEFIASALPKLEVLLAKGTQENVDYTGNAGYVLRMMADLAERLNDLPKAARALEQSFKVSPNPKKLARLVFLYEKIGDLALLQNRLDTYEKSFGLTDRMKVIKAESGA